MKVGGRALGAATVIRPTSLMPILSLNLLNNLFNVLFFAAIAFYFYTAIASYVTLKPRIVRWTAWGVLLLISGFEGVILAAAKVLNGLTVGTQHFEQLFPMCWNALIIVYGWQEFRSFSVWGLTKERLSELLESTGISVLEIPIAGDEYSLSGVTRLFLSKERFEVTFSGKSNRASFHPLSYLSLTQPADLVCKLKPLMAKEPANGRVRKSVLSPTLFLGLSLLVLMFCALYPGKS